MRYARIKLGFAAALLACGMMAGTVDARVRKTAVPQDPTTQNLKTGNAYLAKIARQPGVITLPSGVMYKVVSKSLNPGAQPTLDDAITINYEGKLLDGTVFDSSFARNAPATMPLGRLVPAWQQVIPLMHTGDEVILYTPPSEAYGDRDLGVIPPNSTLIFRVQLLGIGAN